MYNKVDIRDLVSRAGFELKQVHDYWELSDTVKTDRPRTIYKGKTLLPTSYLDIIEELGVFTDDLLFTGVIDYIFGTEYDKGLVTDEVTKARLLSGTIEELYDYIVKNNIDIGDDIAYLHGIATGDTQYFKELEAWRNFTKYHTGKVLFLATQNPTHKYLAKRNML